MHGDLALSLLDHPEAHALRADAEVFPGDVRGGRDHGTRFRKRDLPLFHREEQRGHAAAFVRGPRGGLERPSAQPIASQADLPREVLPYCVGRGAWDDETVLAALRRQVREEWADDDGVIVLDPSAFPQKGPPVASDRDGRRPPRRKGKTGPRRKVPFVRVDSWARKRPADRGTRLTVRDGAKGPLQVEAVTARVRATPRRADGSVRRNGWW